MKTTAPISTASARLRTEAGWFDGRAVYALAGTTFIGGDVLPDCLQDTRGGIERQVAGIGTSSSSRRERKGQIENAQKTRCGRDATRRVAAGNRKTCWHRV